MSKISTRILYLSGRLFSRQSAYTCNTYFRNFSFTVVKRNVEELEEKKSSEEDKTYNRKIIYNEVLFKQVRKERAKERKLHVEYKKGRLGALIKDEKYYTPSFALKYMTENVEEKEKEPDVEKSPAVYFPFDIKKKYVNDEEKTDDLDNLNKPVYIESPNKYINERNFIQDGLEDDVIPYDVRYGTVDPKIPPSSVPCGGCGAHLHCTDMAIPGFIPKEIFKELNEVELRSIICQRCHFLKEYDMALGVNVSNEEYPRIISKMRDERALALIMIDLLDFPCSIWPNLLDIIGRKRPVVVVGNKIDLFIKDGQWFESNIKNCIVECLVENDFDMRYVKHISLISAKTGYGVEELISKIHKHWGFKGDIYLIGCTNVGKSTLFNLLIKSDLCKLKAADVLQRATTSYWPGTTLNLLKFPILRPNPERLALRYQRLLESKKKLRIKEVVIDSKINRSRGTKRFSLSEPIDRTYLPELDHHDEHEDEFSEVISPSGGIKPIGLNPNDEDYIDGKWFYDTPGVVHPDQILNLLTTAELVKAVPKEMILPRNFLLKPGHSLFIGGLARLDYLSGSNTSWFTVFASKELPVTITKIQDAEYVYNKLLGTDYFVVPSGNSERLELWPNFKSEIFEITGKYKNESAGDVVLSSAGWVTVTLKPAEYVKVEAWTPDGRGLHVRQPGVIKTASQFRGSRIAGTPAFNVNIELADEELQEVNEVIESDELDEL